MEQDLNFFFLFFIFTADIEYYQKKYFSKLLKQSHSTSIERRHFEIDPKNNKILSMYFFVEFNNGGENIVKTCDEIIVIQPQFMLSFKRTL
jgi:hypothetical protein